MPRVGTFKNAQATWKIYPLGNDAGEPVGAGSMIAARHPDDAADAFNRCRNPRVVGGDDHRIDAARRRRPAIHVFDHRPAGDVSEWFSWEPGGVVAGRDDGDGSERL